MSKIEKIIETINPDKWYQPNELIALGLFRNGKSVPDYFVLRRVIIRGGIPPQAVKDISTSGSEKPRRVVKGRAVINFAKAKFVGNPLYE